MTHDFCQLFTVKECRKMLWKMTCAFLSSEHADGLNRFQRSDYIFLYEMLLALVEASYLIEAKRKNKNDGFALQNTSPYIYKSLTLNTATTLGLINYY